MLSASYTISDVKSRLSNVYSYYGYASDALFTAAIVNMANDVMVLYFYPKIGQTEYDRIALLNKTGLTTWETYLYWAEVWTICYNFLGTRAAQTTQLQTNSNERLTVEGYTYQTSAGSGASQGDVSYSFFKTKAFEYWALAGFNINSLQRTCTVFGDSSVTEPVENIII
jgi:hypothetical protein